jgi:hypothetical protein
LNTADQRDKRATSGSKVKTKEVGIRCIFSQAEAYNKLSQYVEHQEKETCRIVPSADLNTKMV